MSRFKYPVDTDQFQRIREDGKVYVDKTDLMFDLVNRYNYVFLARPRRFGKSMLCNTFKAYFQGKKELFEGLKIMDLEKEWKKYPVLYFKFSQMSIFSELNNLNQISMIDEYSGLCGITQEELDTVLRPCVEEYASNLEMTTDEAYALLKEKYDGYHFARKSQDIYAPFSLMRALNNNTTDNFWFESGTSASLIEHLKHFPGFNPLDFDGVEVALEAFNVPCENASTPVPMLYQSGYLTIDYYNKEDDVYVLHFPNYEVRQGMVYSLTNYLMDISDWDRNATVLAMARALKRGDLPSALTELRSYIASLPYDIITRKEWMAKKKKEAFYKLLMYVVFSLLNSKVDTEVKSVLGRADVVVKTKNDIYVLELKVDDSVDNALAQIDSKGYAIPYEADGRAITKCGVTISSDARNITHWRAVDKDGNVIDEQKYE